MKREVEENLVSFVVQKGNTDTGSKCKRKEVKGGDQKCGEYSSHLRQTNKKRSILHPLITTKCHMVAC